MKILPVTESSLVRAKDCIQRGGIVAHATETCYGFACDLTNPDALQKLALLKNRPTDQPVSALFPSIEKAMEYVVWNKCAEELAKKYLPGPMTIILPVVGSQCIATLRQTQKTLGIRVSPHPVAQKLAELCSVPLSTTSANLHGTENPYSAEDIQEQYAERDLQPDLILDSGTLQEAPPSTVVSCIQGKAEVLREGTIKLS